MPDDRRPTTGALHDLAKRLPPQVRFGPSSWTYPGWAGLVYEGPYPRKDASTALLGECARWPLFRTVGIDSAFYAPPSAHTLERYSEQLPAGFECVSKVWQELTVHTWTRGQDKRRAGEANENFLNAALFVDAVYGPYRETFSRHMGPFVFEFSPFGRHSGMTPELFTEQLDRFLERLPPDAAYAVELRDPDYLTPAYLEVLRGHGVAHVVNSWARMPTIGEQLDQGVAALAPFVVCRALQPPGMSYTTSVETFAPFDRIREPNPGLRADLVRLVETIVELGVPGFVIVNNRTEGCSPLTIAAVAEAVAVNGRRWTVDR
jgi:uncharacterized protein YecE (DUF72 family)